MKVEFSVTDRDGKKALWVNDYNIWDLKESELTEDVGAAITHAYYLGIAQYKDYLKSTMNKGPYEEIGKGVHFKEEKK